MQSIEFTTDVSALSKVGFCVDNTEEHDDVKKALYSKLGDFLPPNAIVAPNSATTNISLLGKYMKRAELKSRVIGAHWLPLNAQMNSVELIRGLETSDETVELTRKLLDMIGVYSTVVQKDVPGNISMRLLMPMINEACFMLYTASANTVQEVDVALKLTGLMPAGPLEMADHLGLDVCLW